ncbi:MAG: UDP-2,3-diacylglucosamine diphosphatase LpxI [Candidatus Omnitrophica bacterium]|nr:UDP-2,3-diacylglucosamine diphosphatase LpxI [Candidatus Omnitrophota bacterium]
MKLGIIAGNRLLPIVLAKAIKKQNPQIELVAFCFNNETSGLIKKYADRTYWFSIGSLGVLRDAINKEGLSDCIMAGQITPLRIFNRKKWDSELLKLVEETKDMRPHTIFSNIIKYLEQHGVKFIDSTAYLKESLAQEGVMNGLSYPGGVKEDIEFGAKIISRFADLDIGQTIAVKNKSVVAVEALEGTDNTIKSASRRAGTGMVVLKFSKVNQDLRFDVPVVGIKTLSLLKGTRASALVLEAGKVLILEKAEFLNLCTKYSIPVIGINR